MPSNPISPNPCAPLAAPLSTRRIRRVLASAALLAAALSLGGCGGGSDGVLFNLGIVVAGQPLAGVTVDPGAVRQVSIYAGQTIELDASEPVDWTLYVGGSAVTGSATVSYDGVTLSQTAVSPSRISVSTSAYAPSSAPPVLVSFVATSTYDSTQVATVDVAISN
ncbi:MAG: hypothetical protein KGI35_11675 [Burkholderiales bacterium]|nr:hypothetical protein [Burkholderiales bacterium]